MKYKTLVTSMALLILTACGGGSTDNEPSIINNESGVVSGLVTNIINGERLSNVNVFAGDKQTTTNDEGEFVLTGLANKDYVVRFEKTDFAPGYENVLVLDSSETLLLSLKKESKKQNYDADTSASIFENTVNGPYAVIFEAGVFDTNDTNLRVSVTPLDPTIEASALPGQLETENAMLVPLTFADFNIYDSSGNKVNLLDGKEAIVELPIPLSLRNLVQYKLGETIHCYSYNPETGQWEDFVVGRVVLSSIDNVTPVVRASIKHFSWYGAAPQSGECIDIYGQVISSITGNPLAFARVEAFPGSSTKSDANGFFRLATAAFGNPKLTASRSFIDIDGSVGGTAGARVIEYGSAADISLTDLITRPCGDVAGANPSGASSTAAGSQSNPLILTIGNIGKLSYEVVAYISDDTLFAFLYSNVAGVKETGEVVTGGRMVISGPNGEVELDGNQFIPGWFSLELNAQPGERYTLKIDADNNGTIDGTGSVYITGEVTIESPINNTTVSAQDLIVGWADTAYDFIDADSGYSTIYWLSVYGSGVKGSIFNFDSAFYLGSDLSFAVKSNVNEGEDLLPGDYTATIFSFGGAYLPNNGSFDFDTYNNITGPSVTGQFYMLTSRSDTIEFTIE